MKRLFATLLGALFLFGTAGFVYAQFDVARKMAPIIAMLLLDDDEKKALINPVKVNDTGIDWGGDYPSGNNATCEGFDTTTSPTPLPLSAQDCHHGRDATHNNDADGHAGFSFTRLNADGSDYTGNGNYATEPWSCVKDNVTGRVWEVKTDDGGIHDKDNTYRWGGKTHLGNFGTEFYDDWDSLVDGSSSEALCGFSDWRVPTVQELENIASRDRSSPAIDTAYFPNTPSSAFWSASPYASGSSYAWSVYFSYGESHTGNGRDGSRHVRLVRDGE